MVLTADGAHWCCDVVLNARAVLVLAFQGSEVMND